LIRGAVGFVCGACVGFGIAAFLTLRNEGPPAESQATVVRSLQLRINDVDKVSRGRGDRYRKFNCTEANR
jgi:hypothetical protein